MSWNSGAATDTGRLRDRNEDRYWTDADRGVFLVADGVGGNAAGELAAETAVEAIRESIFELPGSAAERVREAIVRANNRIFEKARAEDTCKGMACVLTLAVVDNGQITIGHVGDSRLYLIWNSGIRKLTSDHSPVGEGEDTGELTEEEAMAHPRRHEVFRDVGSQPHSAADGDFVEIRQYPLREDAAILLCSDGLTDQLTSAQVRGIVEGYGDDPEAAARALVDAANQAGGRDNITALVVAGPKFHKSTEATRPRGAVTRARRADLLLTGRLAFLIYGALLGMALWAILRARGA